MSFTRAIAIASGDALTSRQQRSLARAANDRLRFATDFPWRVAWALYNGARLVRNPLSDGLTFPAEGEFWKIYAHLKSASGYDWPLVGPGIAEGANLGSVIPQFIFGNSEMSDEPERIGALFPLRVNGLPAVTPSERWTLGKIQRGVIVEDGSAQYVPAFEAAQTLFRFAFHPLIFHGKSFGGWQPQAPQDVTHPFCAPDGMPGDRTPNRHYFWTGLSTSTPMNGLQGTVTTNGAGQPVVTYGGSCPCNTFYSTSGHVLYIADLPFAWYVHVWDGTTDVSGNCIVKVDRLDKSLWVEGPYSGAPEARHSDYPHLLRTAWHYVSEFRGTESQRTPDTFSIEPIAFDAQKFYTRQYPLAPAYGRLEAGGIVAVYPWVAFFAEETMQFNTIADLRAITTDVLATLTEHRIVRLAGHTTPGDPGGGGMLWQPTSTATDDNGSVVQPTAVTGAGRFVRLLLGGQRPCPEMFGGAADSTIGADTHVTAGTDNALPIERCMAAYGTCELGEGTYGISRFLSFTNPAFQFSGQGHQRSHLALFDNGSIAHASLFAWGTFFPDAMVTSMTAAGAEIRNLHFYNNGFNRRVADRPGYLQPMSKPIALVGYDQRVHGCRFNGLSAASGSTGGVRTPGLPEAHCVSCSLLPVATAWDYSADWVLYEGPKIIDNIWEGPLAPQTDPLDFPPLGAPSMSPEITCLLVNGFDRGEITGLASVSSGSTALTSATPLFESWMAGQWFILGTERLVLLSVTSPTAATLVAPATVAHNSEFFQITKYVRRMYSQPEIRGNCFRDLKIWRTSDTDKQLRAIHGVTIGGSTNARVVDNQFERIDGAAFYVDNGTLLFGSISGNRMERCYSGIVLIYQSYAFQPGGAGAWAFGLVIRDNVGRHGLEAVERLDAVYLDAAGTAVKVTVYSENVTNLIKVYNDVSDLVSADMMHPATPSTRKQTAVVENVTVSGNDFQAFGNFFGFGCLYFSNYRSEGSFHNCSIENNILGAWHWVESSQTWLGSDYREALVGYGVVLGMAVSQNYNPRGATLPVYLTSSQCYYYPPTGTDMPFGYTQDYTLSLDWNTPSGNLTNAPVVPDNGGLIYLGMESGGADNNSSLPYRFSKVTLLFGATWPPKIVLPKTTAADYGPIGPNDIYNGTAIDLQNFGAGPVDFYRLMGFIDTLSRTGGVATIVTLEPHGLSGGETLKISPTVSGHADFATDGATVTVLDLKSFTYASTGADLAAETDAGSVTKVLSLALAVGNALRVIARPSGYQGSVVLGTLI